jgi:hypothetical protein
VRLLRVGRHLIEVQIAVHIARDRVDSIAAIFEMVARTDSLAFVSRLGAEHRGPDVRVIELRDLRISRKLALISKLGRACRRQRAPPSPKWCARSFGAGADVNRRSRAR